MYEYLNAEILPLTSQADSTLCIQWRLLCPIKYATMYKDLNLSDFRLPDFADFELSCTI